MHIQEFPCLQVNFNSPLFQLIISAPYQTIATAYTFIAFMTFPPLNLDFISELTRL